MTDPTPNSGVLARLFEAAERLYDPFPQRGAARPPQRIGAYFRWSYRGIEAPVLALIFCSLLAGLLEVLIMGGVGALLDRAAATAPGSFFAEHGGYLAWVGFLVLLARPVTLTAQGMLGSIVIVPGLMTATVWRLHRYLLGQSMRYFEDDFAGRLAQKEIQASAATDTVTIDVINALGLLISFLIAMIATLGVADWRLGLATIVWVAAYIVLLRATLPAIRAAARERAERRAALTGQLVDGITNIKTVKLFAPPGAEEGATRGTLVRYQRAAQNFGRATTRMRIMLNTLNGVALAFLVGLCLWLWSVGSVTIGDTAAAAMLTLRLTAMSGWIAFTALTVFGEFGTLEDALDTIAKPHEITDPHAPRPLDAEWRGQIRFENVSFRYRRPGDETVPLRRVAALDDVSLTIEPGEKVGLVGPSGAGKSTLVSLLLRLYDVEAGRIAIDGLDVRELRQSALRAKIGVVTQESALFNRSALDNILYGRPEAGEAAAYEAARRAHADAFIRGLRDIKGREGYRAHLGERGVKLSGGQKQRIALARAFLKNAPILVLDEATSALDSEVEAEVLEALRDLMTGRTVIAIAHRLSTIAAMDRIVVLDQGRVVEEGAHDALLAEGGLYARLWARQSGGFLGAAAE